MSDDVSALEGDGDVRLHRVALVVCSVLLPALAIAYRLGAPEHEDPTGERFAWGLTALAITGASFASPWVARNLRTFTQVFMLSLGAWVIWYAADSQFDYPDLVGLTVYQFVLLVVFPSFRQSLLTMGFWLAGMAVAFVFKEPDPIAHPAFLFGLPVTLALIGFAALRERDQLLGRLARSHEQLERRVQERTAQLESEVAQRRAAEEQARAASAAKSAFLTRMSHELRTPINAIMGYAELVQEELEDEGAADSALDLEQVLVASRHLLRLVDDVLDVSRIESGDLELTPCAVTVRDLIDRAVTTGATEVGERGNALVLGDIPEASVFLDPDRAVQILAHLLENAGRFTEDGVVRLDAEATADTVEIAVSDTGPGIPESSKDRIFEAFAQVDESTVRTVDGAGLGLTVCRELTLRMGGTITVDSIEGEGSTFRVRFPRFVGSS